MKKFFLSVPCILLLCQAAFADLTISTTGWTLKTPPVYKNAYLFVKINDSFQSLPRYRGHTIVIKSANRPIKVQAVVVKVNNTVLGETCKNITVNKHQQLEVSGQVTVKSEHSGVDFSHFKCKVRALS